MVMIISQIPFELIEGIFSFLPFDKAWLLSLSDNRAVSYFAVNRLFNSIVIYGRFHLCQSSYYDHDNSGMSSHSSFSFLKSNLNDMGHPSIFYINITDLNVFRSKIISFTKHFNLLLDIQFKRFNLMPR